MKRHQVSGISCTGLSALAVKRLGAGAAAAIAAGALLAGTPAHAAIIEWTGATDSDWALVDNWLVGTPSSANVAEFDASFASANQPTLTSAGSAAGLWLADGVSQDVTVSGGFTLSLAGTTTVNGNANAGILLDDSADHNLTVSTTTTTLSNNTSFLVNNAGTLAVSGGLNLNGKTLTLGGANASGNINVSGSTSSNAGKIIVNTAGAVTLSGNNLNTGGDTALGGTLNINSDTALGTGTFTIGGSGGVAPIVIDNTSGSAVTIANATTIAGNFTYAGTNDVAFSNTVKFSLTRTITLDNDLSFGGLNNTNDGASANLIVNGVGKTLTIGSAGFNMDSGGSGGSKNTLGGSGNITINGPIFRSSAASNNRPLVYVGTGTLTLNDGTSSIHGGFTISSGTVVVGADAPSSGNGALGFGTTAIPLGDANTAGADLGLLISGPYAIGRPITVASQATGVNTIGGINASGTAQYTGNIVLNQPVTLTAAAGGVVDFNTGTWTTNNKAITIGGDGVVSINNALATTAGVTINAGATLGGNGTINAPITVAGALNPGNSVGLLTAGGDVTFQSTSDNLYQIEDLANFDTLLGTGHSVAFDGALTAAFNGVFNPGDSFQLFQFDSYSGNFSFSFTGLAGGQTASFDPLTGTVTVAGAIPEPASGALALLGVGGWMLGLRRRRHA